MITITAKELCYINDVFSPAGGSLDRLIFWKEAHNGNDRLYVKDPNGITVELVTIGGEVSGTLVESGGMVQERLEV